MKIVCMDCQTESYADVELLKDKKRFECEHCAENTISSSNHAEESAPLPSNGIELYTGPPLETLPPSDFPNLREEDVLDISEAPSAWESPEPLEMDEVISLPLYEPAQTLSNERVFENQFEAEPQPLETVLPAPSRQLHPEFIPRVEPTSSPKIELVSQPQMVEEVLTAKPSIRAGIKLVRVSTPILLGVILTFVLFVSLGNKTVISGEDVSVNNAAPSQPVSLPKAESKQVIAPAPAETPEPVKPMPAATPQVMETKPAEVAPVASQPSVAGKGQFTVQVGSHNDENQANEQAAKLRTAGFEARVVGVDIPKRGRWYRIQTGSFNNREEANRYGAQIVAKGAAENFVIAAP